MNEIATYKPQILLRFAELPNFHFTMDSFDVSILYEEISHFLYKEVETIALLNSEKRLLLMASIRKISKLHSKLHTKMKSEKNTVLKIDLLEAITINYILSISETPVLNKLFTSLDQYLQEFQ